MVEIELLKFLKESHGASVYDIMKRFSIKRTAALYRLERLNALGLITDFVRNKKKVYLLIESAAIKSFFRKKIEQLEHDLAYVTSTSSINRTKRSQRLTLSFINYYDLLPKDKKRLEKYYNILDFSTTQTYISRDECIKRSKEADVIVNNVGCDITEDILRELPRLQYIHATAYMLNFIDLDACKRHNVAVSNVPASYRSTAISEFVLAQTFSLLRETIQASGQVRSGVNDFRYFKGEQLRGKKAILFGTAPGTKELINLLKGLGIEIAIYAGSSKEDPAEFGLSHFATEDEVFSTGDIFYIPWTSDEDVPLAGKIDQNFLDKIKRPVYIISIYKHKIIDFQRLRELVYSGMIRGIAFDYFPNIASGDSRQPDTRKLMYLPNVVVTPDIAWYTQDSVENLNKFTTERLIAYAQGRDDYLII